MVSISTGDRIAQLLVLPPEHGHFPASHTSRRTSDLHSTVIDLACLSLELDQRPMLTLIIEGKTLEGLVDTGEDRSIIATRLWPSQWPLKESSQSLQCLGYAQTQRMCVIMLTWHTANDKGMFCPFVVDLPINLWGGDIQKHLKLVLTNEYSETSQKMMQRQGFVPGKGLGARLQGRPEHIVPEPKADRKGLGFS